MQRNLVKDWMTADPITISPDTVLPEARELMVEHNIRRLLVIEGNKLKGIVTWGDLRGAEPSDATSLSIFEINYLLTHLAVEKIMADDVISIGPNEPIGKAARLMKDNKISGLPVVDKGKVVGIITESDIFRMVVEEWEAEGISE